MVTEIAARFATEQPAVEVLAAVDVGDGQTDMAETCRHHSGFGFLSHDHQAATTEPPFWSPLRLECNSTARPGPRPAVELAGAPPGAEPSASAMSATLVQTRISEIMARAR